MSQAKVADPEIDDPEDLQDATIRAWMRTAPDFREGRTRYIVGRDILPPRWRALQRRVSSLEVAKQLVRDAARNGLDTHEMRALCRLLPSVPDQLPADEMHDGIAAALASGELWILRGTARPEKGKADPAVFAGLNSTYGTAIDFAFLAEWEGGQYLHGYVPFSKGIVAGKSGMTIATGFDVGQKSKREITAMKLPPTLEDKIDDFADVRFKGMNRQQVIDKVIALKAPVPIVTKAEADLLDKIVHGEHLVAAKSAWDGARAKGVPAFTALPEAWQTVLFSRFFHQGKGANQTAVIKPFWNAATAGEWETAITALANYAVPQPWYKARVGKESRHLRTQIPAYRPPKKPDAAAAGNAPGAIKAPAAVGAPKPVAPPKLVRP